jgi:hypothetical protein
MSYLPAMPAPSRANLSDIERVIADALDQNPGAPLEKKIEACLMGGLSVSRTAALVGTFPSVVHHAVQNDLTLKALALSATRFRHTAIVEAIESHRDAAVSAVVELMSDAESEKVRLEAAKLLLTYAPPAPEKEAAGGVEIDLDFETRRAKVTTSS